MTVRVERKYEEVAISEFLVGKPAKVKIKSQTYFMYPDFGIQQTATCVNKVNILILLLITFLSLSQINIVPVDVWLCYGCILYSGLCDTYLPWKGSFCYFATALRSTSDF